MNWPLVLGLIVLVLSFIWPLSLRCWRWWKSQRKSKLLNSGPVARTTRDTFEQLTPLQRLVLRMVYHRPGVHINTVITELRAMGLSTNSIGDYPRSVQHTNLITQNAENKLEPSPSVKAITELLLAEVEPQLSSKDFIKGIISEVWSLADQDCNDKIRAETGKCGAKVAEKDKAISEKDEAITKLSIQNSQFQERIANHTAQINANLKSSELESQKKLAGLYRQQKRVVAERIPSVIRLFIYSDEADRLALRLYNLMNLSRIPVEFTPSLQTPLSDDIYNIGISSLRSSVVDVWRFKQDFEELRNRSRSLESDLPKLKNRFLSANALRSDLSPDSIIGMLREFSNELKHEVDETLDHLLDAPGRASPQTPSSGGF
jgi:hypothetical protein